MNVELAVANLAGNVLLLVPLVVLVRILLVRGWGQAVAVCAAVSVLVELAQLVIGRATDVDDVLLNTLGASLVAGAAVLTQRIVRAIRSARSGTAHAARAQSQDAPAG